MDRQDYVIEVSHVSKSFKDNKVLKDVSLLCESGKIYGLVGHNGSGKTVLFKSICGFLSCDEGTITVNGKVMGKDKDMLTDAGIIIEDPGFLRTWSGYHNLEFLYTLRNKKNKDYLCSVLRKVGLDPALKRPVGKYSLGMRQRLALAQAIMEDPGILILDEPTAGLDPKERVRFRNLISSLAENRIVILSTHIVSDVEYIANEILIMKNGELIQHGSPEEILKPIEKCVWECDVSRKEVEELELNYVTANLKHNNGAERLRIISQEAPCRTAWNVDPTLEDLYLYYFAEVSEHE